ncbi:MAG TPA: bifunctional DNA-formamidopyrimidine glycosylase/DNA-(apurinic or apyrimidinic site) lyase [bacterium]|nr:bifunctional DNA-formamidopyrimidine glycosylase/DNA-(apurinic or apyrimidinic site) lyase [bacterium]
MPELPEVETIKENLRNVIKGKRIKKIEVRSARAIKNTSGKKFIQELKGDTFKSLSRRGKYLIFSLKSGRSLVIHLGMTGRLIHSKTNEGISDYNKRFSRVIFTLSDKEILHFVDMRGFGGAYLIPKEGLKRFSRLINLGPEPLSREFTPQAFKDSLKRHKARIKPLLLNQQFLAGLGNIYVSESLYRARISPLRRTDSLSDKEVKRLHSTIQKVLMGAILSHGTSIDSYVDAKGRKGSFQFKLRVYRREGEKCFRCARHQSVPGCRGRIKKPSLREELCYSSASLLDRARERAVVIKRIKQNNRSTYFCPECQK